MSHFVFGQYLNNYLEYYYAQYGDIFIYSSALQKYKLNFYSVYSFWDICQIEEWIRKHAWRVKSVKYVNETKLFSLKSIKNLKYLLKMLIYLCYRLVLSCRVERVWKNVFCRIFKKKPSFLEHYCSNLSQFSRNVCFLTHWMYL